MKCVIGVDLGGTNVRAAAISEDGAVVGHRVQHPSRAKLGHEETFAAVCDAIEEVSKGISRLAVGIAIPGHIDDANGMVLWAPNFGRTVDSEFDMWIDVPAKELLSKRITAPIVIGNDANAAAIGEYQYGVGDGRAGCLVLWTLGTGIGSGVVLGPKSTQPPSVKASLLVGANGGAVELGHTTVQVGGELCTCGAYGCVEAYCGTPGLMRLASAAGSDATSPEELHELADGGDENARQAWREFGSYLGAGVGNSINSFAPDVVALSGQIAKAWDHFEGAMHSAAERQSIPSMWKRTRIVPAKQLEDAGILGAAAMAWGIAK